MTNPLPNLTHDKDGWPSYWPVLTDDDMCQGSYTDDSGMRHCLDGWRLKVLLGQPKVQAYAILADLCAEACGESFVLQANDHLLTKDQAAAIWNKAGIELGYTEDGWEEA